MFERSRRADAAGLGARVEDGVNEASLLLYEALSGRIIAAGKSLCGRMTSAGSLM